MQFFITVLKICSFSKIVLHIDTTRKYSSLLHNISEWTHLHYCYHHRHSCLDSGIQIVPLHSFFLLESQNLFENKHNKTKKKQGSIMFFRNEWSFPQSWIHLFVTKWFRILKQYVTFHYCSLYSTWIFTIPFVFFHYSLLSIILLFLITPFIFNNDSALHLEL